MNQQTVNGPMSAVGKLSSNNQPENDSLASNVRAALSLLVVTGFNTHLGGGFLELLTVVRWPLQGF